MNNRRLGTCLGCVLGCLLFVAALRCEAQNLVPNPSFEEADTCWHYSGFTYPQDGPLGWFSGGESPDYFQACGGYGAAYSQPLNYVGFQYPQDGDNYAGILTYATSPYPTREFLMVQLNTPLSVGQTYYVSFYANVAWNGNSQYPYVWMASNNVGALFTTESRQWEQDDPLPAMVNHAQVYSPWIIADTVAWTSVSGSFVADSAYQYLMIGNHFDNAHTDTVAVGYSLNAPAAYLFIDNVCLTSDPEGCPSNLGIPVAPEGAVELFPNPATAQVVVRGLPVASRVEVRDMVGRLVWREGRMQGVWKLDVSGWARGAYVLRVQNGEEGQSFKFVLTE